MENELRYYLEHMQRAMAPAAELRITFVPTYLVTAVKLPTGAIELAVINDNIAGKIDYILEAYDDNMRLKTNVDIEMSNVMIV